MSRHQDFIFDEPIVSTNGTVVETNTTVDVAMTSTDLSEGQEIALILLQMCSATLSLIGSSLIVIKILRSLHRNNSSTPYDRIILGLSSCDIVASFTYMLAPFLLPSNTSNRVWAFGSDRTCTWLGFLAQLACYWAIWYNCILSFYYLLTVRFQVKRKEFTRKYELWMHLSGAIFFPLTAIIGLIGNWYSEMRYAMICWIGEVPKGCQGCWGVLVAYLFGAPSSIMTLLAVVINNIIIYVFVRRNLLSSTPSSAASSEFELTDIENSSQSLSISSPQRVSKQQRLRKEAATQGFLYVTTFLLTFLPAFSIQVIEGMVKLGEENLQQVYPLLVLNAILLPLQGFFNVFIYVRPNYNRFKAKNPDDSMTSILKHALFDPNIPRISTAPLSGPSADPNRALERSSSFKKYSESKKSAASNFSMSLDNIVEENSSTEEKEEEDL